MKTSQLTSTPYTADSHNTTATTATTTTTITTTTATTTTTTATAVTTTDVVTRTTTGTKSMLTTEVIQRLIETKTLTRTTTPADHIDHVVDVVAQNTEPQVRTIAARYVQHGAKTVSVVAGRIILLLFARKELTQSAVFR